MSDEMRKAISATQEKFRLSPDEARAHFQTHSELRHGFRSDISVRTHSLVVDEPAQLGGGDAGPNPIELLLAALGACQEITYKAYATAMGIDLKSVSVRLDGEIDLRGFFGVDDTVRAGFEAITGVVVIDSDAPVAELERLKQVVDLHCPVLDMLSTPVPVSLKLAQE